MNIRSIIKRSAWIYRPLLWFRSVAGRAYMGAAHALFGVDRKKIVFSSFAGRAYSDSPRVISERLHEMKPDYKIVWHLSGNAAGQQDLPAYVVPARARTLSILFHYATARVIVDNFNRPWYIPKYSDQVYVQTWHGDRGFKKIMFDLDDGVDYPDGRNMDLAISGSEFGTRVFRSAFHYQGEVLQVGMPRNDLLMNPPEGLAAQVRARLGIAPDVSVMLYAPTFRDSTAGKVQKAAFDIGEVLKNLELQTGDKWVALVRSHAENRGIACDFATDVSNYPEMAHLLLIADLLITDYSSSACDYALLKRPVVLYQPDRDEFEAHDRSFYFDIDKSPYWTARNLEELYAWFARFDEAPCNCEALLNFYEANETGRSCEAVCAYIIGKMEGNGR